MYYIFFNLDPTDVESPRNSFIMGSKFLIHSIQPPIDEELNLILGTISGRGRSLPTSIISKVEESPTTKVKAFNDVVMQRKKSVPAKER
jgi:hypothetical protein